MTAQVAKFTTTAKQTKKLVCKRYYLNKVISFFFFYLGPGFVSFFEAIARKCGFWLQVY